MTDRNFQMRCVKVSSDNVTSDIEQTMDKTFQSLKKEQLSPKWFSESDCLKVTQKEKNCYYMFNVFEGQAFEHLAKLNCRIFGPQCMLTSLEFHEEIPKKSTQIYNLAMKNIVVCCTNIEMPQREKLYKKVLWMGGQVSTDFTGETTHLVAGEVGSKKYIAAGSLGKHIMLKQWVEEVWEKSKIGHVHGLDEQFQHLKCPIFMGLSITVSGFPSDERKTMQKLIQKEGGEYSGEMKIKTCTHLVINEPKGTKYNFAIKWKIKIVRSDWIYDSIEKGYCQDEKDYRLSSCVPHSTPERKSIASMNISNISSVGGISMMGESKVIDETRASNISMSRTINDQDPLDDLDLTTAPDDLFLDGCKFYLYGLKSADLDKMKKIINAGGGTRYNQIKENITHVVVSGKVPQDVEDKVKNLSNIPHVVTPDWLVESFKKGKAVAESEFTALEIPALGAASPKPRGKKSVLPSKERDKPPDPAPRDVEADQDDEMNIMSQYLVQPDQGMADSGEPTIVEAEAQKGQTTVDLEDEDMTQDPQVEDSKHAEVKVFSKKLFIICGFEEDLENELATYIVDGGGEVLAQNTRKVPDYAIVPIEGFPVDRTVNDIVTYAWLQMCLEQNKLLAVDSSPLFHPLQLDRESMPLDGCVISISGFAGTARDLLTNIAECLGARTQEYFVRTVKPDNPEQLQPSTHLVVAVPEGNKYQACKKWGLPAVTMEWLLACARSGQREPESEYLIENSVFGNVPKATEQPIEQNDAVNKPDEAGAKQSDKLEHPETNSNHSKPAGTKKLKSENKEAQNNQCKSVNAQTAKSEQVCDKNNISDEDEVTFKPVTRETTALTLNTQDGDDDLMLVHAESLMLQQEAGNSNNSCDTSAKSRSRLRSKGNKNNENRTSSVNSVVEEDPQSVESIRTRSPVLNMRTSQIQHSSQKENITTPVNSRVKNNSTAVAHPIRILQELQQSEGRVLLPRSPATQARLGIDTPGKFLDPEKEYIPTFNLSDSFCEAVKRKTGTKRKTDEMEVDVDKCLDMAVERCAMESKRSKVMSDEIDGDAEQVNRPWALKGVIIAVSKKLAGKQAEYNDIVESLGGDYRWTFDETCTHFIFQGTRTNDLTKEFRQAKELKKFIVSPHWIYACRDQNLRVDESMYPHTYNPNLTLSMTKKRAETPARPTRRRRMMTGLVDTVPKDDSSNVKSDSSKSDNSKSLDAEKSDAAVADVSAKSDEGCKTDESTRSEGRMEEESTKVMCDTKTPVAQKQKEENKSTKKEDDEGDGLMDHGGTLEMKEELTRQFESILASSKAKKQVKENAGRKLSSSGQMNMSGHISSGTESRPASRQGRRSDDSRRDTPRTRSSGRHSDTNSEVAASQMAEVVWDDPTGRKAKEVLARELERACSPTQEVGDGLDLGEDAQFSDMEEENKPELLDFYKENAVEDPGPKKTERQRTPTPEPPSLAFPMPKCDKTTPPKPVELPDEESPKEEKKTPPPTFMFSGLSAQERDDYGALVEQLGGQVLEGQNFDTACTHVVIRLPSRNEKFLAGVASGKWVLHKSYFEACRQEKDFVQEDFYEWGSEGTMSLVENMDTQVVKLSEAAHRWRVKIQQDKKKKKMSGRYGAFCDWRVILCCDKTKEANFRRLLEAGGASVLPLRPPFTAPVDATHALMEPNKISISQEDLECLVSSDVLCCRPDFIAAHLTGCPSSNPEEFFPQEVKDIRARLEPENLPDTSRSSKRRKTSSNSSGCSTRSSSRRR